uniref:Uncharacterized protein n=1 Tax=Heterosigma akashiwo TaxID=2829 RepID=D2Z238_HETAK|nr:hypothetical protein HeakM_p07 [Heterosigma akashiwo]BAI70602.1 hypothetical protein [Heterosigma akashiwo]
MTQPKKLFQQKTPPSLNEVFFVPHNHHRCIDLFQFISYINSKKLNSESSICFSFKLRRFLTSFRYLSENFLCDTCFSVGFGHCFNVRRKHEKKLN